MGNNFSCIVLIVNQVFMLLHWILLQMMIAGKCQSMKALKLDNCLVMKSVSLIGTGARMMLELLPRYACDAVCNNRVRAYIALTVVSLSLPGCHIIICVVVMSVGHLKCYACSSVFFFI